MIIIYELIDFAVHILLTAPPQTAKIVSESDTIFPPEPCNISHIFQSDWAMVCIAIECEQYLVVRSVQNAVNKRRKKSFQMRCLSLTFQFAF